MERLIRQLYWRVLRREADPEGLKDWLAYMQKGGTLSQLAFKLANSEEAKQRRLSVTDACRSFTPPLDVVVPMYNKADMTIRCLEALYKHTPSFSLLLVDDHSDPEESGKVSAYLADKPNAKVIRNEQNLGFQDSVVKGLSAVTASFVCLLNNDVFVAKGWKEALLLPFQHDHRMAVTGPFGGIISDQCVGAVLTKDFDTAEYIEFSCAMIRSWVLDFLPLCDENLHFAFGEDADFSLRAREMGLKIQTVHLPKVVHLGNQTFGTLQDQRTWRNWERRNLLRLKRRWASYLASRDFETWEVLFKRAGAMGDVLCLEPAIRSFKLANPLSRVLLDTQCWEPLRCHPLVERFVPRGVGKKRPSVVFDFDMAYEENPAVHIVPAYMAKLPNPPLEPLHPLFFFDPVVEGLKPQIPKPFVVACSEGSWENRTMPLDEFRRVLQNVKRRGYNVVEVGLNPAAYAGVGYNLKKKTSLQELALLIKHAAFVVGHDSLPLHLAESLGVPGAYVFSCINPRYRLHREGLSIPVQNTDMDCLGCHHLHPGRTFSACNRTDDKRLGCVQGLTLDHFLSALDRLEKRH
jgi:GT2 family glycosyltransferase